MMWALDFTLNSVTMLALVLMVGIVIDDAIVVLENIFRFVEEKKMTPMRGGPRGDRARSAWRCWRRRCRLVVIFIPVSFMSSISGRFLYQFGITAAVAVHGQPAGELHAHADDERAAAAAADDATGHGARRDDSRGGFYGLHRRASTSACSAFSMRHRLRRRRRRAAA